MITQDKTPVWFLILVIIMVLPVFQFPVLLNECNPDNFDKTLVWIYPFYVAVAGYLAYICYPKRQTMAWILIILMAMTHVAVWMLVQNNF